ncbi:hypothetical protein O6072_18280 [Mycolicibacterium neoaurum]|uniref:hypothetical protein n=1 Tax=Mycolicibacterium neoaurum TaxID=1795 RepID=UPI00248BF7D7|nr:hypothetical protein [Mycolicibacterium neoaurum]WBP93231.1 hypothetical protein O7W24_18965 [Mycolicibacterium neoaurum]WBS06802.1 hypothetical protein O6072_18280 [Mycolicibacterium neoaurum]
MNHNQPPEYPNEHEPRPLDWNLPISLTDAQALGERLTAASDTDTIITTQDAQTIARCLSDQLKPGLHSAIRQFAEIGSINAPALRNECLSVHTAGDLSPGLKRWAAWLITYAAHALPPDAGGLEIPTDGDALDMFLKLPDLNRDTVLEDFKHAYCGSYTDIDAVLDGVTDVREWEQKIRELARELGCNEFVSIDREAIEWHLREGWDVIPGHGRMHVFFR